jgi:hypothetical protein
LQVTGAWPILPDDDVAAIAQHVVPEDLDAFLGMAKGMPSPALVTPLPPFANCAVVAIRLVAS